MAQSQNSRLKKTATTAPPPPQPPHHMRFFSFLLLTIVTSKQTGLFPDTLCLSRDDYRGYCARSAYSPSGVPYSDVEVGRFHTCAVRRANRDTSTATPTTISTTASDGVDCFGDVSAHSSRPRTLGAPLLQVCVGEDHGCGVDERSVVHCWGEGTASSVPPLLQTENVAAVTCGDHHTCVLISSDGSAQCFGESSLVVPNYKAFDAVVVDEDALSPAGLGTCSCPVLFCSVLFYIVLSCPLIECVMLFSCSCVESR